MIFFALFLLFFAFISKKLRERPNGTENKKGLVNQKKKKKHIEIMNAMRIAAFV